MPGPIKVTCPNCDATLKLKDDSKIGLRVICPKCSDPFVVEMPDEDESEDYEEEESINEELPRQRRRTDDDDDEPGRRRSRSKKSSKPKGSSSASLLIIGGSIAAGFVLIVGLLILVGLQWSNRNNIAANPVGGHNVVPALPPQGNLSDAACEECGRKLEAALMSRQAALLSTQFDWNKFAARAVIGLGVSARDQEGFTRGVTTAVENPNGLIGSLSSRIGSGSAKFIRVTNKPDGKRILVRLIFEDGTSNYTEWVPGQSMAGELKIVDGYSYLSGELFTTTIRRLMIPAMASLQPTLMQKLSGAEREAANHLKQIQKMTTALHSNQPQQALETYAQLPETLKREKALLLQRLSAAQQVSDNEYEKVLVDFDKYYPGDPALDFVRLDYWVMKKDHQAAVDGLKRLEKAMEGTDGHLHGLLAIELAQVGRFAEARTAADESIQLEPEGGTAYQAIVLADVKEQKYEDALQNMKQMFEKTQLEFLEMATDPDFAGFVKSPQYNEWLTFRREKG
ncbi:MAG: hypothetical protein JSS49_07370 [Planctomycetes bacterium]|nr:hypothetical protein [Planctomycetota bacterium]